MATFLINTSNLKQGGGIQVAQSICGELYKYRQHRFVVVLSESIDARHIVEADNIEVCKYEIKHDFRTVLFGRNEYLDNLVSKKHVNAVLTVFGPSLWRPRVPHLCGFARAQLLLRVKGFKFTVKERIKHKVWTWLFRKSSNVFYTENTFISNMLSSVLGNIKVYTVTNYYNQIFDHPEKWKRTQKLTKFDGLTCLSISSHYPHKNFEILPDVVRVLKSIHPEFKVRFVLTFDVAEMPIPDEIRDSFVYIGKVSFDECPCLYEQAGIMFMPTLMECFTATYPEAMRMGVPIVTTDLEFARGLCGDAACYYSAIDAKAAAEAIYKVATDKEYARQLTEKGKEQLLSFDNYEQRTEKLIRILEEILE